MLIKVTSEGPFPSTRVTGPDGELLRDVSNVQLYVRDGLWYADLEVSPVRVDITADVLKVICEMKPPDECTDLTITFTATEIRNMIDNRLRVLSGGQKIGTL